MYRNITVSIFLDCGNGMKVKCELYWFLYVAVTADENKNENVGYTYAFFLFTTHATRKENPVSLFETSTSSTGENFCREKI